MKGDGPNQMSLDAISRVALDDPRHEARHGIEHAGYPAPGQIRQMASMGVIPVYQPRFLHDSGDEFLDRLGDRAHRLQPCREELDQGIPVVLSSDSFVASYKPLETIGAAVRRRTRNGSEIGRDQELTVEEAVLAYTIDAAASVGMGERIGSLEPGKLADLVVVDGDLFGSPPERIADLPIWLTMIDGTIAHASRAGLEQSQRPGAPEEEASTKAGSA